MLDSNLTRRKALFGIGSIATVGVGVSTLSGNAQAAEVEMGDLHVADKDKLVRQPIKDVRIVAPIQWSYNGNTVPDKAELNLKAGTHPDSMYSIALYENSDLTLESDSGEKTLQASLFNAPDFSLSQFQTSSAGETKSVNALIGVSFRVIKADKVQAEAYAEDVSSIQIENGTIEMTSSVGGTGEVSIVTES
jgi:hypothetical protein